MPISFIFGTVVIIYLAFYKKVKYLKISPLFLGVTIFMILCGFFIKSVNFADKFEINIIFALITLMICFELLFKLKPKTLVFTFLMSIATALGYYGLTLYNNDYISFLNYYPAIILVSLISVIFLKNLNASIALIILSYILIETFNYFVLQANIGFLSLFSMEYLNAVSISVMFVVALKLIFSQIKAFNKKSSKKEMKYEK